MKMLLNFYNRKMFRIELIISGSNASLVQLNIQSYLIPQLFLHNLKPKLKKILNIKLEGFLPFNKVADTR